jgi:hypothetical protein
MVVCSTGVKARVHATSIAIDVKPVANSSAVRKRGDSPVGRAGGRAAAAADAAGQRQREGGNADRDVAGGGDQQRAAEAEALDQRGGGGGGAAHRAEHVAEVEPAEGALVAGQARAQEAHHQRERRAHAGRERQDGAGDPERRSQQVTAHRTGSELQQRVLAESEQPRHRDGAATDGELDDAVGDRRAARAAAHQLRRQPAAEPRAEREAGHEGRQQDRQHRRDDAEGREGEPQPDDLVDESAEAGHHEQQEGETAQGGHPGSGRETSGAWPIGGV